MELITNKLASHRGHKIEQVRKLRGLTQSELGDIMGISKQAISKMEQTPNISDERLEQIAVALQVTFEGLKNFSEDKVLYNTNNFYENCGVNATSINANVENINNPLKETIEMFERQLAALSKELLEVLRERK